VTVGREFPIGALGEHGEKRNHSTAKREGGMTAVRGGSDVPPS
jgi:hypothetical protein